MNMNSIRDSLKKHHYIDIPAIISLVLTVLGVVGSIVSGFTSASPSKIYKYMAVFGFAYQFGYNFTNNFFLALLMNLIADFAIAFVIYWIGWKAYGFFRKN
jgi:hypothetical protein